MTVTLIVVGMILALSAKQTYAAFFDRDKLAQALANRFNLNEREVAAFLADFQYNPEQNIVASPTPTPTPVPTLTPVPSSTPTPTPASIVINEVGYVYDDGTDQYYPATSVVDIQHKNHLDFIAGKLTNAVDEGEITKTQKKIVLDKLAQMMKKSPSSQEFKEMGYFEQRSKIATFKKEMQSWLKSQGMTLSQLSEITGKGNKYLMGIYFD